MGDTFELDQGDRETLRGTLHDPQATVGDVLTVQADKSIAAQAGGGAAPDKWVRVPIAFDTPGLEAGLLVYTPALDSSDYLLDGWIEVDTAWDGTTPLADVSTADPADIPGTFQGLYTGFNAAQDMSTADTSPGQAVPGGPGLYGANQSAYATIAWTYNAPGVASRIYPCRLAAGFPVYVVVSQDGTPTGGPCGGAAGAGHVVLLIGTP